RGGIIQQRTADELQTAFVLRKVDVYRFACPATVVQSSKNSNSAKANGYKIYVWSIEKMRRSVWLADKVCKAAQRRQLRAESWLQGMRAGLPKIACAQHDERGVPLTQDFVSHAQPRHDTGAHVLNDDIGPFNQPIGKRKALGMLEVYGHAVFRIIEESETAG